MIARASFDLEQKETKAFRKGDRVVVKPEWRDVGDDLYEWLVLEDEDGDRVLVQPLIVGLTFTPRFVAQTYMLEHHE